MNTTTILVGLGLIGVLALIWWYKYYSIKPRKKKEVKYISTYPNLTMKEFDFYDALNRYAPNDLILDRIASEQAMIFAVYCDAQNRKRISTHVGVGERITALRELGATDVSEIYDGGYRTLETSIKRLKESKSHNRTMLRPYTHVGVGVVNNHKVAIYFNIK